MYATTIQQDSYCREICQEAKEQKIKAGKQTAGDLQEPTIAAIETDKTMVDEPYSDVLAFPETGKVSIFKNKNYQVFVFFGIS